MDKYSAAVTLSDDDDVLVTVKRKGYAFNSQYVSSKDTSFSSPSRIDLELKNIEEGKSFLLNNIYFDIDSYDINSVSNEIISEFVKLFKG